MGIFKFQNKSKEKVNHLLEAPNNAVNKNNYKKFMVKAVGLLGGSGGSREKLSAPEYNLSEIREASEADSYIRMAMMKYSYMLFKAGYVLKGENEDAVNYLKTRFNVMSFATGKPMEILFQEIGDDLIKYSNAFLVKSRVPSIMPGVIAKGFFNNQPVGGYYRLDPSTITIEKDSSGTIKNYVQSVNGEEKKFAPTEMIHFYLDRESGNSFGTPRIIAALEDVKLLRRLEGNVVSMIYRFAMPLFQWIVGLPEVGFQATDREIDEVKSEIDNMALDGVVVTNEKTQIKVIGAEGSALNAEGYLKYFEQRVFSALGVSESQMGRGGAKADADSMESQAHDTVKHIQRTTSIFIEFGVINELLLEGGFNPLLNEEDKVFFVFNEINVDTRIKVENHEMLKYQSNMTTFDEMRRTLGHKEDADEARLHKNMIEVKAQKELDDNKGRLTLELAQQNAANAKAAAKETAGVKGISTKGNGKDKSQSSNKDITTRNRPSNQHGTTSAKVKEDFTESLDMEEKTVNLPKHKKTFEGIYNKYQKLRNDITDTNSDMDMIMPLALDNLMSEARLYLQMHSLNGIEKATRDIRSVKNSHIVLPNVTINLYEFEEMIQDSLKKTLKDIKKKIGDSKDPVLISSVFDAMEYRIRFVLEHVLPKVYWYSYLKTGQALDMNTAYIDFDGSEDENNHPKEIDLNAIDIDNIPPYHPFCDCKINFKAGDK